MIPLSKLQFEIELLDHHAPRGFWGTRLRGGYGDILKKELCSCPQIKNCENCELFADRHCDFPYLFKPHSHLFLEMPKGKPLGDKLNLPAPFVISAPFEIDLQLKKGSRLTFDFVSIGRTIERAVRVIDTFGKLGRQGLDVKTETGSLEKARFQLVDVKDLLAAGRSLHTLGNIGQPVVSDIQDLISATIPNNIPNELVVEFVTPVTVYQPEFPELPGAKPNKKGEMVRGIADFYDLIKLITNRIGGIWQVFGNEWLGQADYFRWRNALLKESKNILVHEIELQKKTLYRFSKNQQQPIAMEGFVGAIRVAGDFSKLLEILLMGELFHIGESTAYSFGQYKLVF